MAELSNYLSINDASKPIENAFDNNVLVFDTKNIYKLTINELTQQIMGQCIVGKKNGSAEIFNDYANNTATGEYSHAEGQGTTAIGKAQHVEGKYNESLGDDYLHIVGNGSKEAPSNAYTLDKDGNAWYSGNIIANGDIYITDAEGNEISLIELKTEVTNDIPRVYSGDSTPTSDIGKVGDLYCMIIG